jgi:hypothetical protein
MQRLVFAAEVPMTSRSLRSKWQESERVVPVTIAVVLLFFGSVVADEMLSWNGVEAAETFLNDLAIAGLGGLTVWILLRLQAKRQEMLRARELMQMTIALNLQVRSVFSVMASSALLKEEADRLHGIDEAMQHLDQILGDLAAKGPATGKPAPVSGLGANSSYPASLRSSATRQN